MKKLKKDYNNGRVNGEIAEEIIEQPSFRDQVYSCFDALAKHLGADLAEKPDVQLYIPSIVPSYSSSGCDHKGDIVIVDKDIGKGNAYFEEVSHSLRVRLNPSLRNFVRKRFPRLMSHDYEVGEFFGRLGIRIGMELMKGTELEHLFDGYEPDLLLDIEKQRSILNAFRNKEDFRDNMILYKNFDNVKSRVLNHTIGYVAADLFVSRNGGFMEESKLLYRKPDRYIRKNYVNIEEIRPYRKLIESFERNSV